MSNLSRTLTMAITCSLLIAPVLAVGQVRESTNYKIERDSLNIGGGFGASDNYSLDSTVGEVSTGFSESDNFTMHAGYQQNLEETFISISSPSDINLANINGVTGGFSTSSADWLVTTNNNAGYALSIKASTSPALVSNLDQFDDYAPSGSDPDFDFSIDSSTAAFGFSPSGADIVDFFRDNGSICNTGAGDTPEKCWDGFSTTPSTISQSNASNDPMGSITTVNFRAESGNNNLLIAGTYSATITVTAIAL
jgi:hypothetical protein